MKIIPAIDIIGGQCVRLSQGDYQQKKVYHNDPLDVARSFEEAGLQYLHLVDLDGAKAGAVSNWAVVEKLTRHTKLQIDFGGGIKTEEEIQKLLDLGIKQVNLGSIAVKNPSLVYNWLSKFGADKIILSADVKRKYVQVSGWQEQSSTMIDDLVDDYAKHGLQFVTCTDIETDGMLSGPNVKLYDHLVKQFPKINWIASGGVSSTDDLHALKRIGVNGVIIGKALYENKIKLNELDKI